MTPMMERRGGLVAGLHLATWKKALYVRDKEVLWQKNSISIDMVLSAEIR
jgi:hypothetical protein